MINKLLKVMAACINETYVDATLLRSKTTTLKPALAAFGYAATSRWRRSPWPKEPYEPFVVMPRSRDVVRRIIPDNNFSIRNVSQMQLMGAKIILLAGRKEADSFCPSIYRKNVLRTAKWYKQKT